eukprot:jgi/Psemu1/285425/fgenesh1_pg.87_\
MASLNSTSELELPSSLYHYNIDEFDADANVDYSIEWRNYESGAEIEGIADDHDVDGDVYDDVCDGQSQSSVFSPSIKQTVRNIDGVLNEIRLYSSPDPDDFLYLNGHGKNYNGYDEDAMSDVSGITTSNLLKELNRAHESFLDSILSVQDNLGVQSSNDNDDDNNSNNDYGKRGSVVAASGGEAAEYGGNVLLWAENQTNHNGEESGDYCKFFIDYDRDPESTPDQFYGRRKAKFSGKFHFLRSFFRSMKQMNEQHSQVQQVSSFSRRTRLRSISICCAILGIILVLTSVIIGTVTALSKDQDQLQPSSSLDSNNTTIVIPPSISTMQTVKSPSAMPTFQHSSSSGFSPEGEWSSSTSTSTLYPMDHEVDTDEVDTNITDVESIDVNTIRPPTSMPDSSSASLKLPVSGASASTPSNLSSSSGTLPISAASTHYGHHYETIYVSTNQNLVTPSLPTSSSASSTLPISGGHANTTPKDSGVDNNSNEGSAQQHEYLSSNEKYGVPISENDPAKTEKKKADSSLEVRRMLRFSTGEGKFGEATN